VLERTFDERSLEIGRPDGFALALERLPGLAARDDGLDGVTGAVVAGERVRDLGDGGGGHSHGVDFGGRGRVFDMIICGV
jgi:hypothetical protein